MTEVKVAEPQKAEPQKMEAKVAEEHKIETKSATLQQPKYATATTVKVCHRCGQPFELTTAKEAFGQLYHDKCFTCHICGQKIFSFSKFYSDNGEIMCTPCMQKSCPKCAGCGKPLVGGYVQVGGRNWHKQCVPQDL